jgi:hypothetical protein
MALNSSGPISFGGSTVGQSINLELGVSATALASIDSTSFRTLAGVASGQISLSNFYGKSNVSYRFSGLSNFNASSGVGTFDMSGNIYAGGTGRGTSYLTVSKISSSYTLSYSQEIGLNNNGVRQILVSGSSIYYTAQSGSGPGPVLNRLSTSTGQTNWPQGGYRNVGGSITTFNSYEPTGLFVNGSGDVYVSTTGYAVIGKTTTYYTTLVKVGADGVPVWFVFDDINTPARKIYVACAEVGGYLYTYGSARNNGSNYYGGITKRTLATPPAYVSSNGVFPTNVSSEFYVSGGLYDSVNSAHYIWGYGNSSGYGTLAKFDSSLTFQWVRILALSAGVPAAWKYAVTDSAGNIYVATQSSVVVIAKYNSSGVLQWARKITLTGSTTFYPGQTTSLSLYSDKLLLGWGGGYDNDSTAYAFFVEYPTDGSKSSGTTTLTLASSHTATLTFATFGGTASTPASSTSPYNPGLGSSSVSATTSSSTSNSKTTTLYSTTL